MNPVIRAWKDASFRKHAAEPAGAPADLNPAGEIELDERELTLVAGAMRPPTTRKAVQTCENWACTFSQVVCG